MSFQTGPAIVEHILPMSNKWLLFQQLVFKPVIKTSMNNVIDGMEQEAFVVSSWFMVPAYSLKRDTLFNTMPYIGEKPRCKKVIYFMSIFDL